MSTISASASSASATEKLNTLHVSFLTFLKACLARAWKSRALGLVMSFAIGFAVGYLLVLFFSALMWVCVKIGGEVFGTILYVAISVLLVFAVEKHGKLI